MAASVDLLDASLQQPKGTLAARVLQCRGLAMSAPMGAPTEAEAYIRDIWIGAGRVKSALGAVTVTGTSDAPVERDFLGQALPITSLGRMPGLRLRPFGTRALVRTGGTAGGFVAEGAAAPIAGLRFARGTRLEGRRVAVHDVVTREELIAEPGLNGALTAELAASFAGAVDVALLDPAEDGSGAGPASILYNAPSAAASGNAEADVRRLIAGYTGDLRRAVVLLHPLLAVELGMALAGSGTDTRLGVGGGVLVGIPAVTSEAMPLDSSGGTIAILDVGALAVALAVEEVAASRNATMEMDTSPTGNSATPDSMTASVVSMFQTNSVALRAEGRADWQLLRADAIFTLTDAVYTEGT